MSMHAMIMGALRSAPVSRSGQSGRSFTTATLRVPVDGPEAFLASLIVFSTSAAEALAEHAKGDTLVVGGRGSLTRWTGRDGTEQHGMSIVVEQVMFEVLFGKRRKSGAEVYT